MATVERVVVNRGRTAAQWAALIFGLAFLAAAGAGFMAGGMTMEADPAVAPKAVGMFPVNLIHNIVHLAFGIWGVATWGRASAARTYCVAAGTIYIGLAVLGWLAPNGFGLVPLGGPDILLHLALGVPLLAIGLLSGRGD